MNRPELDRNIRPSRATEGSLSRMVVFTVIMAGEKFGLPIHCVRTVFRTAAITHVPLAPSRVLGLINLRGQVISALNLHDMLGLQRAGGRAEGLMVAVEYHGDGFAIEVDNVGDVVELSEADRLPFPATLSPARRLLSSGVFARSDSIITLLNIDALFNNERDAAA